MYTYIIHMHVDICMANDTGIFTGGGGSNNIGKKRRIERVVRITPRSWRRGGAGLRLGLWRATPWLVRFSWIKMSNKMLFNWKQRGVSRSMRGEARQGTSWKTMWLIASFKEQKQEWFKHEQQRDLSIAEVRCTQGASGSIFFIESDGLSGAQTTINGTEYFVIITCSNNISTCVQCVCWGSQSITQMSFTSHSCSYCRLQNI